MFYKLHDSHIFTGHGDDDRMNRLKAYYITVTYKDIMFYLSFFEPCLQEFKKNMIVQ